MTASEEVQSSQNRLRVFHPMAGLNGALHTGRRARSWVGAPLALCMKEFPS